MGALGLLALFIRANFSLICNTPRDGVFPDRVKIKITISFPRLPRPTPIADGNLIDGLFS